MNTQFNEQIFNGPSMFIQGMAQMLFATNVCLFMILTGYLNTKKRVCRGYYKGAVKVFVSYLIFSIITIIVRKYLLHEDLSWIGWILKIFDFTAIPYAWYIEMWIGLFLLTPFLNILYENIPTRNQKLVLIATLYLMVALPDLLNRYGMYFAPAFWQKCYPLVFYFIGSYIKEYRPAISKRRLCAASLGICALNPLFNLLFVRGHSMIHICGGFSGVFGIPLSAFIFLCFYQSSVNSYVWKRILTKISVLSLDMFLCSYIFDAIYYPYFKTRFYENQAQFGIYFFVLVPLVFISSFLLSSAKERIFSIMRNISGKLYFERIA